MLRGAKRAPNKFSYKSKFYDAKSEKFNKRIKSLDRDLALENNPEGGTPSRSISFNRQESSKEYRAVYKKQSSISNLIIIILVTVLCLIGYYFIKSANG